jgi:hypothetical protein
MGRFTGAPSKASVGFITLPKDTYNFKIGEPKAYERTVKKEGSETLQQGIRWPLTVESDGTFKGKTVFFNSTQGNEISLGQEKALMMAADGVEPTSDNDEVWSAEHENDDYDADTSTGVVGEGYLRHKGKIVSADVDITTSTKDGNTAQFQKWVKFYPVEG